MIYAEYIPPDKRIYHDFKAILDMGQSSDVKAGLSERLFALRQFVKRWKGHVSDSLIRKAQQLIADAEFTQGKMPELPNPSSYNINDPQGFADLWNAVQQKWFELTHFLKDNKTNPNPVSKQPIDKFVAMTEQLNGLCETFKPKDIVQIDRGKGYNFTQSPDYPGRMVSVVEEEADIKYFTNLAVETKNATLSTSKFIVWDTIEALNAGKDSIREKFQPQVAIKPTEEAEPELEETEDTIAHEGRLVPAKEFNGQKVPMPTNTDGTYTKTMLGRLKREQLLSICQVVFPDASTFAKRDWLIKKIIEEQSKAKNKKIFLK